MRWITTLLYAFILKSETGFNRPGSLSLYSKNTNPHPNKLLQRIRCRVITSGRKSNNLMKSSYRVSKERKTTEFFSILNQIYMSVRGWYEKNRMHNAKIFPIWRILMFGLFILDRTVQIIGKFWEFAKMIN